MKGKSIYPNAIKQFTHAPEAVSFNVLQDFGRQGWKHQNFPLLQFGSKRVKKNRRGEKGRHRNEERRTSKGHIKIGVPF